jgi:hypothetical protein
MDYWWNFSQITKVYQFKSADLCLWCRSEETNCLNFMVYYYDCHQFLNRWDFCNLCWKVALISFVVFDLMDRHEVDFKVDSYLFVVVLYALKSTLRCLYHFFWSTRQKFQYQLSVACLLRLSCFNLIVNCYFQVEVQQLQKLHYGSLPQKYEIFYFGKTLYESNQCLYKSRPMVCLRFHYYLK